MSITSALHKTLFALAFLVSIVHFAMVTQTTWQGLAVIDNLQTWLKLHSDVFPPQFNIRSNSLLTLSDGDYRFTQQALDRKCSHSLSSDSVPRCQIRPRRVVQLLGRRVGPNAAVLPRPVSLRLKFHLTSQPHRSHSQAERVVHLHWRRYRRQRVPPGRHDHRHRSRPHRRLWVSVVLTLAASSIG